MQFRIRRRAQLAAAVAAFVVAGGLAGTAAYAAPSPTATPATGGQEPSGIAVAPGDPDPSGIGLAAGSGQKAGWLLEDSGYYDKAEKSSRWDRTPDGMVFHSCDYDPPSGSDINGVTGVITLPSGETEPIKPCAYPRVEDPSPAPNSLPATSSQASSTPMASGNGWFQGFGNGVSSNPSMTYFYSKVGVPEAPSVRGGQSLFDWVGLSSQGGVNGSLLQPIVGWGPLYYGSPPALVPGTGDSLWTTVYYYFNGTAVAPDAFAVSYQDTLAMDVEATSCNSSGGNCTYRMDTTDDNTGYTEGYVVHVGVVFNEVIGGMFEKANISGCDETFANGHLAFRDQVLDSWTPSNFYVPTNPQYYLIRSDQECGMATTDYASETGGDITWTP